MGYALLMIFQRVPPKCGIIDGNCSIAKSQRCRAPLKSSGGYPFLGGTQSPCRVQAMVLRNVQALVTC